jgi:hypothetical protein
MLKFTFGHERFESDIKRTINPDIDLTDFYIAIKLIVNTAYDSLKFGTRLTCVAILLVKCGSNRSYCYMIRLISSLAQVQGTMASLGR